jgi:photosystem II stability/assembly factor-like uncharacterized protein
MRTVVRIVLIAILVAGGCRTAPVHNIPRTAITAPATATMADLSEAMWAAGRREGWRVREVESGKILAEKTLRTHRALVEIDYDRQGFSMRLIEADNLLYDGHDIHKAYNLWAAALEKSIEDELRFRYP